MALADAARPARAVRAGCADRRVCVLASGDPMFHGIGATLARVLGPDRLRGRRRTRRRCRWRAPGSGGPSTAVEVVSAVGRPLAAGAPRARTGRAGAGAERGRATRRPRSPRCWSTPGTARLGDDRARAARRPGRAPHRRAPRGDWAHPPGDPLNVVAVDVRRRPGRRCRAEVPGPARRRLRPRRPAHQARGPRRHARACSGRGPASCCGTSARATGRSRSSGCAPTGPAGRWPSSRTPARAARIAANADALGRARRCGSCEGRAPDALAGLPTPDAVFIGGGDHRPPGVLDACWAALRAGGRLVANAVTL